MGRNSGENSYYTPVNFDFDNKGRIIEGSFVEVYLKSFPVNDAIVLPVSALIEEQGHFFVFVALEHEGEYVKKEVRIGASDGINRQILQGLNEGDRVVTQGAYAVKLASMSNAMPEHSHQH
ncbi:MAG: efflux RND transporter periplasmic adaptor subunit [Dysgonomonas sp.]